MPSDSLTAKIDHLEAILYRAIDAAKAERQESEERFEKLLHASVEPLAHGLSKARGEVAELRAAHHAQDVALAQKLAQITAEQKAIQTRNRLLSGLMNAGWGIGASILTALILRAVA